MPWHILFFSTKPANKRERIWLWTFCNVARHQARKYSLTSTAIGRQMANASYNDANFVSSRFYTLADILFVVLSRYASL